VTLLGRFYERFADQAGNVARRMQYILDGTIH
jgi:phosphate uptake regulator